MDQPESEGVRLISFDGGDIRAISQLIILDEFMRRVEWDNKSKTRILPCDYFHMMAGVGTGGIIVVLLAVLRMGIEEAIEECLNIWLTVYADDTLDRTTRSAKLEEAINDILIRKEMAANRKLYVEEEENGSCRAFVCVGPESNLGFCEKFRNYRLRETTINPTVVEAIRGTCAIPTLFTPVSIASSGSRVPYVTGAYNFNNPAWEAIKEACEHFGRTRLVACVLSLGCGQPTIRISDVTGTSPSDLIEALASNSELVDTDLSWRIGKSNVYYRFRVEGFHVDKGYQSYENTSRNFVGDIISHTKVHLEHPATQRKVDKCVEVAQRLGRVTLTDISGLSDQTSPPSHGLPSLSAFFVERPELVKKMAECLFRVGPPAQRRMVLSGLGGIGKTQITISFLLQFLSRFRHILFIDGSSVQSIESGVVAKVKSLGTAYARTTAQGALEVLANPDHEITRDWAIIYDNVDDPAVDIGLYFPQCTFGTVLITTRNPNLGNLAPAAHLKLNVMSEEEAVDVLLRSAIDPARTPTVDDQKHARAIAKELGYLPVALVQAGYFIKLHDCMPDYCRRLLTRRPQILNRPAQAQLDRYYHGIYAALEVTWPHLSDRTRCFLNILGFVNYTGFPLLLVYRAAKQGFLFEMFNFVDRREQFQQSVLLLSKTFRPQEHWDPQDVDDLVAELEQYSLITRVSTYMVTTLRFHPLVHSWVHDRLSQEEQEIYQAAAVRLLVCGTGKDDEDIFEFIYPHLVLLTGRFNQLHANDRAGIATILAHQGEPKAAIALWEAIQRNALVVGNSIRASEAKLQLAGVYWKLGDQNQKMLAQIMEREVVEYRKRTLGPKAPMTVMAIVQQARGIARSEEQKDKAVKMLRDALQFYEKQPGDNWEAIIQAKESLATSCRADQSVELWTEVLEARMKRSGSDHHTVLKAMEALAGEYRRIGDRKGNDSSKHHASATGIWVSLVATRIKTRGLQHPDTLDAMENLARSYWYQDRKDLSLDQWAEVVRLRKEAQGPSHSVTLKAMEGLAEMHAQCERYDDAEARWREVIALRKEAQGPSDSATLKAIELLAEMCAKCNQYGTAEEQWKEVIALRKRSQGPNHADTLQAMRELASMYADCGQYTLTEAQCKVVELRKETQGISHEDTLEAMSGLADMYAQDNQDEKAEELWKDVIRIGKEAPHPEHWRTLFSMNSLANLYRKSGRYQEAADLLVEAGQRILEEDDVHVRDVLRQSLELVRSELAKSAGANVSDAPNDSHEESDAE